MHLFWRTLLVTSIIILGMWTRLHQLHTLPFGFFCDEASIAYNAYALLLTGKDEFGVPFPIFFQSFGDWRPPLAVYATIPFVALFGLQEIAPRLMSAFFGIIGLFLLYLLSKQLYSTRVGLWTLFVAATMPWLIHYNRVGFEFTIYCTFFIAMVLFFLKATKNKHWIMPAWGIAALTIYTYQPARLMVPMMVIGMLCIYKKQFLRHKTNMLYGIVVFVLLSIPLLATIVSGEATARFAMISVFSANLPLNELIDRVLHNYLSQLGSLFFLGEQTPNMRHFANGLRPLLLITIPFYFLGWIMILRTLKKNSAKILLLWLLLYPIAGAVVAEPPFTSRALIGAPVIAILISVGITSTIAWGKRYLSKPLLIAGIILAILINFHQFYTYYLSEYARTSSGYWGWQYGPKEIINYFSTHENEYDDLIMANEFNGGHIFFAFYAPGGCQKCRIDSPETAYTPDRKQLFALPPDQMDQTRFTYQPVDTIYYPDGTEAFILTEIHGEKDQ